MGELDLSVFHWINRWPESLNPLFWTFSEGNKLWPIRIGFAVLAIVLLSNPKLRVGGIAALLAWPLANGCCDLLKGAIGMKRPSVEVLDAIIRVKLLTSPGMPSAHSANMAAVALVFCYYYRWWGTPAILVAILTGLSRVYVGVHYPSQVLAGWLVGSAVAGAVVLLVEVVRRRFTSQDESLPAAP